MVGKEQRVLLIGHYGFANRGCEAIVRGSVAIIRHHLPGARITLISRQAAADERVCRASGIGVDRVVPERFGHARFSPQWGLKVLGHRLFNRGLSDHDYRHRKLMGQHHAVLSIGGDNFSDDYGGPGPFFDSLKVAQSTGAKAGIWAASIGPFKETEAGGWAKIMQGLDLITVREPLTQEYLEKYNVRQPVHRVADPAFVMEPQAPAGGVHFKGEGQTLIGLGISDLLRMKPGLGERYAAETARFVANLVKQPRLKVLLVPHVVEGRRSTDDYAACEAVAQLSGATRGSQVEVVPPEYHAAEMKFVIGQCDGFIGARTHSTIASLSMLVPTITIGYSVKAFGINRDIFGHDEFVIPVEGLTAELLEAGAARLLRERREIGTVLKRRVPELRALALSGGKFLAAILN